jgi:hypothetical protein
MTSKLVAEDPANVADLRALTSEFDSRVDGAGTRF